MITFARRSHARGPVHRLSAVLLLAFAFLVPAPPVAARTPAGKAAPDYVARADVRAFIDQLVAEHGFDRAALRRTFAQVRYQRSIVAAMERPLLAPPKWYEYAPRFLSPARDDPPDIDLDVSACRRDEVLDYIYGRFGADRVAMICTYATMKARMAVRDVAKAHGLSPEEVDSFSRGLLDFPHYTRPAECRGLKVPDVLLSGHHEDIRRWRKREALRRTVMRRPDLLESAELDSEEREMLRALLEERGADDGRH